MPYSLYFCYSTGWITLAAAAGATVQTVLNILADADFQADKMTLSVRQANVIVQNWGGDMQIDDSGRGRTLFNQASAANAFFGNGQLPYYFNPPRLFRRNSSVTVSWTNNVATATDLQLVIHGNKLIPEDV